MWALEDKLIFKIGYLSTQQQERVLKLIEEFESTDSLTTPRIILSNDNQSYLIRIKFAEKFHTIPFSTSPVRVMVEYMRAEHKLLIGEPTAQKVIEDIGSALPLQQERTYMIKGRNLETSLPASSEISSIQIRDALSDSFDDLATKFPFYALHTSFLKEIEQQELAQVPIILRGTLQHIRGLDQRLQEVTGLKVILE